MSKARKLISELKGTVKVLKANPFKIETVSDREGNVKQVAIIGPLKGIVTIRTQQQLDTLKDQLGKLQLRDIS